jgi:hypothetical protein
VVCGAIVSRVWRSIRQKISNARQISHGGDDLNVVSMRQTGGSSDRSEFDR